MTSDNVQVAVSRHCELVVRGPDGPAVLDRLAAWVRKYDSDILITGLQWTNEWVLDADGVLDGNKLPSYLVTMQFRTGAQLELHWGED